MVLSATIWGPKYWFVLHTIAQNYPIDINDVTKKKYYEFIHNVPLFIPDQEMGNRFGVLLDKYPLSPYLDSRTSFIKWMHFIHNKINSQCGKKEITMEESMNEYYKHYRSLETLTTEDKIRREKMVFGGFILASLILAGLMYQKGIGK